MLRTERSDGLRSPGGRCCGRRRDLGAGAGAGRQRLPHAFRRARIRLGSWESVLRAASKTPRVARLSDDDKDQPQRGLATGVPLNVIQRQLGHRNLVVTSIDLQGIDPDEIIQTVHGRRPPMIPASFGLTLPDSRVQPGDPAF